MSYAEGLKNNPKKEKKENSYLWQLFFIFDIFSYSENYHKISQTGGNKTNSTDKLHEIDVIRS